MQEMIVLVAHGSSDPEWANTFVRLTSSCCQKHPQVRLAFMELSEPGMIDIIEEGSRQGYTHFKVLPLFLARGKHLKKDIPAMLTDIEKKLKVKTELLEPIGEHPLLANAMELIIRTLVNDTAA